MGSLLEPAVQNEMRQNIVVLHIIVNGDLVSSELALGAFRLEHELA